MQAQQYMVPAASCEAESTGWQDMQDENASVPDIDIERGRHDTWAAQQVILLHELQHTPYILLMGSFCTFKLQMHTPLMHAHLLGLQHGEICSHPVIYEVLATASTATRVSMEQSLGKCCRKPGLQERHLQRAEVHSTRSRADLFCN